MRRRFHNTLSSRILCIGMFLVLQVYFCNLSVAQQPWNFLSTEDACLGDAYFVAPPGDVCRQIESNAIGEVNYNDILHISGPYSMRKSAPGIKGLFGSERPYIRFQNTKSDFYLLESDVVSLLPYLVSVSYWQERFNILSRWSFIDRGKVAGLLQVDTVLLLTQPEHDDARYNTLHWLDFQFQPSEQWPVTFNVVVDTGNVQVLTLRAIERLAEWGAFATYSDWCNYLADNGSMRRNSEAFKDKLQRQDDSLSIVSQEFGRQADSLLVALRHDSIAEVAGRNQDEVNRLKRRMNREEIFLMNINPARSEYMFGLEFNFYNCFRKTISQIEITVTPYNERSRVQEDKFGRSERTIRCMGPITPGSPAQYLFDELYWNENGSIKFMRVTGLVFRFSDGTIQSYYGYNKIMRHCLNR